MVLKSMSWLLIDMPVDNFFEKNTNKSGELWGKFVYLHLHNNMWRR